MLRPFRKDNFYFRTIEEREKISITKNSIPPRGKLIDFRSLIQFLNNEPHHRNTNNEALTPNENRAQLSAVYSFDS